MIEIKTMQDFINLYLKQEPYVCLLVQPEDCVVAGLGDIPTPREDIKIYNTETRGGTIICKKGDIGVSFYTHEFVDGWKVINDFANYFVSKLREKGINAEYKDNDILVDDHKCCGMSLNERGKHLWHKFCIIQISMTVDIPLIQSVCTKPMKKIPKGLAEYGLKTEEVVEFIKEFFAAYEHLL